MKDYGSFYEKGRNSLVVERFIMVLHAVPGKLGKWLTKKKVQVSNGLHFGLFVVMFACLSSFHSLLPFAVEGEAEVQNPSQPSSRLVSI